MLLKAVKCGIAVHVCLTVVLAGHFGFASSTPKYKAVPETKVNVQQKDRARTIASDILKSWQEGKFQPFPDDFDDEVKKISTPEAQEKAADQIKKLFGEYKGIDYVETVISPILPGVVFYRFKGHFSQVEEDPEVLVVFDGTGKITGFWVKPWEKDTH